MRYVLGLILAVLIAGLPLRTTAGSALYDFFKTETTSEVVPEPDVCIGPVGPPYPCGPAETEVERVIRLALLRRAQHYRSVFFSGNSCNQSPENYRNLGSAMEILLSEQPSNVLGQNNREINAAIDRVDTEVRALTGMTPAEKQAEFRNRMAAETNRIVSSRAYDDAGDTRMMGNCTHIAQVMYVDLLAELRDVPGVTVSIYHFAGKDPASNLSAHYFNVVECGGSSFVVDAWRGAGEVYGPLSLDPTTNTFIPKRERVTLDDYYGQPLKLWLSKTTK